MEKHTIIISKDFSEILGGRWIRLGPFSGEVFYNIILHPQYQLAVRDNEKLHIYMDGTKGYGSSFLDQSFGELARVYGVDVVEKALVFHTQYFEWFVNYIKEEIWSKK